MKIKTYLIKYEDRIDHAFCECGGELKGTGSGVSNTWGTQWFNRCDKCNIQTQHDYSYPHGYRVEKSRKALEELEKK